VLIDPFEKIYMQHLLYDIKPHCKVATGWFGYGDLLMDKTNLKDDDIGSHCIGDSLNMQTRRLYKMFKSSF